MQIEMYLRAISCCPPPLPTFQGSFSQHFEEEKIALKIFYNKGQNLYDTLNKGKEKFIPGYTKYLDKMSFFVYDDE